jgi:bifunctional DNase/RNase
MDIEVKIRGLMMDPNSGTPIIILKDVNSEKMLPIWVGANEANAIALEVEKIAPQRPMTHDLLRNLILEMGATVHRVVITELRDNTFFAIIEMIKLDGGKVSLDSRPSDAIALALRVDSPIFVNESVISTSHAARSAEGEESAENDEWPDLIGDAGDLPM